MEKGLNLFIAFVYGMNIIIGAGFLSLPHSFKQTGVVLSLVYLFFGSILSAYLSLIFLEVMYKTEQIIHREQSKTVPLLEDAHHRRINVFDVISTHFGKKAAFVYMGFLTINFLGLLVAYTSVFAASFSSNVPLPYLQTCDIYAEGYGSVCMVNYWIYAFLFGTIVSYLTYRGLNEQKTFQIVMFGVRLFVLSVIVVCCVDLWINELPVGDEAYHKPDPALVDRDHYGSAIPTILISTMVYQVLLPGFCHLVRNKEENLWKMIVMVSICIFVLYGLLGVIAPFAIDNVQKQITLNFRKYSRGETEQPLWCFVISQLIIILPTLDVISCFPFNSISVSDNWKNMIYGDLKLPRYKTVLMRLGFSFVPLLIGATFYDLVI
jgi:amino acid permease